MGVSMWILVLFWVKLRVQALVLPCGRVFFGVFTPFFGF